ncbi:uncharacterized protein LOC131153371 isoform X2 [Malania oleifera]|uniref:uncharacterized protein LOC131153371 isoform X2 n=1 Tax=Malania oleifera TaxID=397392 RepID=UPI0025ADC7B6|nr:uncharacterized protein LOC131153371 isoform X2 [Malania oleifera]
MSLAAMVSGTKRFASTATVPTSPSLTRVAANHRPSYVDPDLWPCFFLQQQNTAKDHKGIELSTPGQDLDSVIKSKCW